MREYILQGVRSAGGNADRNHHGRRGGAWLAMLCWLVRDFSEHGGGRKPLLCAAALILPISSSAISGMRAETSAGLATKSKAPRPSAFSVMEAPLCCAS